jgi:hypothetical protein
MNQYMSGTVRADASRSEPLLHGLMQPLVTIAGATASAAAAVSAALETGVRAVAWPRFHASPVRVRRGRI